jgi:excinuclease ABC subunit A
LVDAGNSVILVDHDMKLAAASDLVTDIGPGAGDAGGRVLAAGSPAKVASFTASRTATYLRRAGRRGGRQRGLMGAARV